MNLLGLTVDELKSMIEGLDEKPYRAKQLYARLMKGVAVEDMTELSGEFKAKLLERHREGFLKIVKKLTSSDGTIKYLFKLDDDNVIESVLMRYKHGNTVCVSTQAGCRMGCVFCASCASGLTRNLTAGEMLSQVLSINRDLSGDERCISNVVLMGSGEPLDNYGNTVRFLRLLHDPEGLNISFRNISLSTCGIVPKMYDFINENLPVTLCISLHAPDDEMRRKILPVARSYSIFEVLQAAKKYYEKTGRRIIIEYTMIRGLNDRLIDADKLKELLLRINCHVNLIPCNEGQGYSPSPKKIIYTFLDRLKPVSATVRRSLGSEIEGACGQLRKKHMDQIN